MNATLTQISAALYSIIQNISVIKYPYAYVEGTPGGYPAAYPIINEVLESDMGSAGADTVDDVSANSFIIRVLLKDEHDAATAANVLTVADAVFAELRKRSHQTLGGLVERFQVAPKLKVYRSVVSEIHIIVLDFTVIATQLVALTS